MPEAAAITEPLAAGRIRACALAALAALLPEGASSQEAAFLRAYAAGVNGNSGAASQGPADEPLQELADRLQLHRVETLAVALAAAVETDLMCGRAVAHLQAPIGGSRPTLGLLAAAFAEYASEGRVVERLLTGAAVESGLLQLLNESAPLAERAAAVPVPLCLALSGRDAAWPGTALGLAGMPEIPLPFSVSAEAHRQARALTGGMPQPLSAAQASAHQPSSTLRFRRPFTAAFIPEVPLASSGAMGLLSQTSTPETSQRASCMS